MKNFYLFTITLFLFLIKVENAHSTHYMGGEISWECMNGSQYTSAQQGRYKFTLKLYRECYVSGGSAAATYSNTEYIHTSIVGLSLIAMNLAGTPKDISPSCYSTNLSIKCTGMPSGAANKGAIQVYTYTSDLSNPNGVLISGIPPTTGWKFYYGSAGRNPSTNISSAVNLGFSVQAMMYPYKNKNTYPCYDNSPVFAEPPITAFQSGKPYTIHSYITDKDYDDLNFSWSPIYDDGGTILTYYQTGYSYSSPFPGPNQNAANVAASLDSVTGAINLKSFTSGAFVASVKVSSIREGIKVAENLREFQYVIAPADSNLAPFIFISSQNQNGDTIYEGDSISISAFITDINSNPNGNPQNIRMNQWGEQFGSYVPGITPTLSTTTGCTNPPCASLTPAASNTSGLTGTSINTQLKWVTACQHLKTDSNGKHIPTTHYFFIKAMDDNCPIPASNFKKISVTILPRPLPFPPKMKCITVNDDGTTTFSWSANTDTTLLFNRYNIYSTNGNGNFILQDSISDMLINSYTDTLNNANFYSVAYNVKTLKSCYTADETTASDTLKTIFLKITSGAEDVDLQWNDMNSLSVYSKLFYIYRQETNQNWTLIDSTSSLFYHDHFNPGNLPIAYRIEQKYFIGFDTTSNQNIYCFSKSNKAAYSPNFILDKNAETKFSVKPNPCNGKFLLQIESKISSEYSLIITNTLGEIIYQSELKSKECFTQENIDLSAFKSGIYILNLKSTEGNRSIKLLLQSEQP